MDNQFNIINDRPNFGAKSASTTFVSNVFAWMSAALVITAIVAYVFGTNLDYMSIMVNETGISGFGYFAMFAPMILVFVISAGINRMSSTVLLGLFLTYSVLMGLSLSFIFLIYDLGSVFKIFFTTSAMFGTMAVLGYTTKTDLTKFGNILMMALIGIIIASLINFFTKSETMDYVISSIGVLVFTGLTAYDVQKIKEIGAQVEDGTESTMKLTILGALNLYLDFINLFIYLLRLFGSRRD